MAAQRYKISIRVLIVSFILYKVFQLIAIRDSYFKIRQSLRENTIYYYAS